MKIQSLKILSGKVQEKTLCSFKCIYLAIYVVEVFDFSSMQFHTSWVQDPIVRHEKNQNFKSFNRNDNFACFRPKKQGLGPPRVAIKSTIVQQYLTFVDLENEC